MSTKLEIDSADKGSLARAAHTNIREDILSGKLAPDCRLRMPMLREKYKIGASPLREALSQLTSERLVVASDRRGFAVAPISLSEFRDLTNVRKSLEKEALSLSVAKGGDRWEADVIAAFHHLNRVQERFDPLDLESVLNWETRNREFHEALVSACGSPWLMRMRSMIFICTERYRRICLSIKSISRDVKIEHQQIMEAAIERDTSSLHVLISEHLEATYRKVEESGKLD